MEKENKTQQTELHQPENQELVSQQKQETKKTSGYDRLAKQIGMDTEMVAVIHQNVAKNTSLSELAYFLNIAKSSGLNPFNKEIWCYRDNKGNVLIFTGRDGFLKIAQSNPRYNGFRSHEVCEKDDFQMEINGNGVTINHKVIPSKTGRGEVLGAYFIGFLKDGEPYAQWVDIAAYDKGYNTWKTHKQEMIKKVAESQGLKKCFGITGLNAIEDFNVVDGVAMPIEKNGSEPLNR